MPRPRRPAEKLLENCISTSSFPIVAHGLVQQHRHFFMFNRAPRVAHICLRCQRDLARKRPGWLEYPPRPSPEARFVRHQSVAAAEPLDDYDDHDPNPPQTPHPDAPDDQAVVSEEVRDRKTRWRRLKRAPRAGLGVQSLGKPSEIILLPSRDRVIPRSVEYEDGPKQSLSAAIESEKAPVNWEQVKEHIELTRRGLDKQRGPLDHEEWDTLRLALKRGFSRIQLRRFLQERAQARVEDSLPEEASRPQIAALIATEVWGYQLPPREERRQPIAFSLGEDEIVEPEASVTKEYTNANDLLLLQRDPKYGFQSLASAFDVSVSITGNTVTAKGKSAAVEKAKKWLDSRVTRLKNVELDGYGHTFFVDDKSKQLLAAQCQKMGTDWGVVLSRHPKREGMHVRHMQANKHAVVAIRRDLRLMAEAKTWPSLTAAARPERIRFAPYFTATPAPWSTEANQWGRGFDTVVPGSAGMTRRAETSARLDEQWEEFKEHLNHPLYHTTMLNPHSVRCEVSTRFGLNLYHAETMSKYTGLSMPQQRSWFVDEVPLVAQLLANNNFRDRPSAPTESDIPAQSPLIARLLLKPVHLSSLAPAIEIYLYGEDPAAGLQQTLNVARITTVLDSQSRSISLPTLPVDISFTKQLKQDLFVQRSPAAPQHPRLLESIGSYLRKARKSSDQAPDFHFFFDFRIPTDLTDLTSSPDHQRNKPIEYVLAAVETVTEQSRLTPDLGSGNTRLVLQHLAFAGGRWGPDRHELRVAQEPLLAAPRPANAGLDNLRTVTLDVAERFGDMARQLRHRMQAVK